jgi:hypothetical protein
MVLSSNLGSTFILTRICPANFTHHSTLYIIGIGSRFQDSAIIIFTLLMKCPFQCQFLKDKIISLGSRDIYFPYYL